MHVFRSICMNGSTYYVKISVEINTDPNTSNFPDCSYMDFFPMHTPFLYYNRERNKHHLRVVVSENRIYCFII